MKVLAVVSGQKWLGGLTIHTALLCRELERLGHRVAVVSIGEDAVVDLFPRADALRAPRLSSGATVWGGKGGAKKQDCVFRYEVVAIRESVSRRDARRCAGPWPPDLWRALGMTIMAPEPDGSRPPCSRPGAKPPPASPGASRAGPRRRTERRSSRRASS